MAQAEMAVTIARLEERLKAMEVEFRATKAEIRADALRETQTIVNAVQAELYPQVHALSVQVAVMQDREGRASAKKSKPPKVAIEDRRSSSPPDGQDG